MKLTNQVLTEALKLEELIKKASLRLGEIKKAAKEKGSFCTTHFAVTVKEQQAERLVGKEAMIDVFGRDVLEQHELLHMITFEIVKIARKQ